MEYMGQIIPQFKRERQNWLCLAEKLDNTVN